MAKEHIDEKLDFLLYFKNQRIIQHLNEELIIKAKKQEVRDKELIDVSSEEVLDEIDEQNKNNDKLFETEKLD